ncbi:MAG: lysophospholipid acyltransferase family protein [Capsulimonadales bacterium]|nr:lysophospholipid acyltransferase family protein [Capsulimonadales bacterium]
MKYTFIPPRLSEPLLRFVFAVYDIALPIKENVTRFVCEPEDWNRLADLKGKRAILLCNHPSLTDPPILFGLSRRLKEPFYYVASYDLFVLIPWLGWFINRLGAFSIQQGGADRESLKMSQEILIERHAKLVILPEGEPNFCNERMQKINPGAIQIGIWAAEKLVRKAEEEGKEMPALPVLPIVIKYRHVGDPRPELTRTLEEIERALGIVPDVRTGVLERTCHAAKVVLSRIEKEYDLPEPTDGQTVDDRIERIYGHIEQRILTVTHSRAPRETERHTRMRALFNLLYDFRDQLADGTTSDERRRHERRKKTFDGVFADMRRYENFMTISADFLTDAPSTERWSEMLYRLSKEVLGREIRMPRREAIVRIGEPTDIVAHLDAYKKAKRETLLRLTEHFDAQMRGLLESMRAERTPIEGP